jgi:large subunit ribosomal protein L20
MTRIKAGVAAHHRHKKTLALAKGYSQGRRKLVRIAHETVMKALAYAYRDRRARMAALKTRGVTLNRKVLADLAVRDPAAFAALARAE